MSNLFEQESGVVEGSGLGLRLVSCCSLVCVVFVTLGALGPLWMMSQVGVASCRQNHSDHGNYYWWKWSLEILLSLEKGIG